MFHCTHMRESSSMVQQSSITYTSPTIVMESDRSHMVDRWPWWHLHHCSTAHASILQHQAKKSHYRCSVQLCSLTYWPSPTFHYVHTRWFIIMQASSIMHLLHGWPVSLMIATQRACPTSYLHVRDRPVICMPSTQHNRQLHDIARCRHHLSIIVHSFATADVVMPLLHVQSHLWPNPIILSNNNDVDIAIMPL